MGIKGYSYGQSVQISMFSKMDTFLTVYWLVLATLLSEIQMANLDGWRLNSTASSQLEMVIDKEGPGTRKLTF